MTRSASFTVRLNQSHTLPISVNYATVNKTAKAGLDYTPVGGVINFAPGEVEKTVNVSIQAVSDRDLTFSLQLSGEVNCTLSTSNSGLATIVKDNHLVSLVNAAISAKNSRIAADSTSFNANASAASASTSYNNALAAYNAALADYYSKDAAAVSAQSNADAAYNAYVNLLALAQGNPAYQPAALQAGNDWQNAQNIANQARYVADQALSYSNQKSAEANSALSNKNYWVAQASSAATAAATAATAEASAKATAAAGFVGSTSLQM